MDSDAGAPVSTLREFNGLAEAGDDAGTTGGAGFRLEVRGFAAGRTTFAASGRVDLRRRRGGCGAEFFFAAFGGRLLSATGILRFSLRPRFSSFSPLALARSSASSDFSAWAAAFLADFFVNLASFRAALSFNFAACAARLAIFAAFSSCAALACAFSNTLRTLFGSDAKFMVVFGYRFLGIRTRNAG
jgi:hypothetical protein